jgi:septal ring factor EnvC (AmiA/AmiB activator)
MLEASSDLPDNVAALQAMIALQNDKLSIFEAEIKERDYRIEKLEHQLAGLRHHRFGARSEALDQLDSRLRKKRLHGQLSLLLAKISPTLRAIRRRANQSASHCRTICPAMTRSSRPVHNAAPVAAF